MKSNVTSTSILSYRELESEATQILRVAAFLEKETKRGKAHSIRTIATNFYERGDQALGQISSVAARLNKIKDEGVVFDGRKYELTFVRKDRNPGGRMAEFYALVLETKKESEQLALF